jgi:hypothetical protein
MQKQPTPSNALVTSSTTNTVATTSSALTDFLSCASATLRSIRSYKPTKTSSVSFPFRIEYTKECAVTSTTLQPSLYVSGTVGSLANCCGAGIITGPDYILIPIKKTRAANENGIPMPRSVIDERELTHKLITTGSKLGFFVPIDENTTFNLRDLVYVVSLTAGLRVRIPNTRQSVVGGFAGQPRQPAMAGGFGGGEGISAFPGKKSRSVMPGAGTKVSINVPQDIPQVPAATPWSGHYLTNEVADAYTRPDVSNDQKKRLELEYPELAIPRTMSQDLVEKGYEVSIGLTASFVMPLQKEEYAKQAAADVVELYQTVPEHETIITRNLLDDPHGPAMVIIAREPEWRDQIYKERANDTHCKIPVMCQLEINKMRMATLPGQPANSPFLAFNSRPIKFDISNSEVWNKLAELVTEKTNMWLTVVVDPVATVNMEDRLGSYTSERTRMAFVRVIDLAADFPSTIKNRIGIPITQQKAAELLHLDLQSSKETRERSYNMPRFANLSQLDDSRQRQKLFSSALASNCDYFVVSDSAIVKDGKIKLADLGQEVGTALFDPKWYDTTSYHILDAGAVKYEASDRQTVSLGRPGVSMDVPAGHPLRIMTGHAAFDLNNPSTTILVYAVRKQFNASAARAARTFEIFCKGGSYKPSGLPEHQTDEAISDSSGDCTTRLLGATPDGKDLLSDRAPQPHISVDDAFFDEQGMSFVDQEFDVDPPAPSKLAKEDVGEHKVIPRKRHADPPAPPSGKRTRR